MNHTSLIYLNKLTNSKNGELYSFDSSDVGFDFRRLYYINNVTNETTRGYHAHKELYQALVCLNGVIEITLDDGLSQHKYILDNSSKVLKIGPGIWREMTWKKENSILCVVASDKYDEDDYIRDYDTFIEMVKEGYWSNEN